MVRVSNGFAELLPHKTYRIETVAAGGEPQIMAIRSLEDLFDNVTTQNPVQPVPVYPGGALLPSKKESATMQRGSAAHAFLGGQSRHAPSWSSSC